EGVVELGVALPAQPSASACPFCHTGPIILRPHNRLPRASTCARQGWCVLSLGSVETTRLKQCLCNMRSHFRARGLVGVEMLSARCNLHLQPLLKGIVKLQRVVNNIPCCYAC